MKPNENVFVTGITGNQGGAVARQLIAKGFNVTGLTRRVNSEKARLLKTLGVTLIEGDLNDVSTFQSAIAQSHSIFFVQALQQKSIEIKQGIIFIDAVKAHSTNHHLVYSSVMGADLNTGIPHFESKFQIEQYLKESLTDFTILRPASFYENYLIPQVYMGIKKGKLVSPLNKSCIQQMIGVEHLGIIAGQVISNAENYKGKTLSVATDQKSINEITEVFSDLLQYPVKYRKLPGFMVKLIMGNQLYKMFNYMNQHEFCVVDSIREVRDKFSIRSDFKNWVIQHFTSQ